MPSYLEIFNQEIVRRELDIKRHEQISFLEWIAVHRHSFPSDQFSDSYKDKPNW